MADNNCGEYHGTEQGGIFDQFRNLIVKDGCGGRPCQKTIVIDFWAVFQLKQNKAAFGLSN